MSLHSNHKSPLSLREAGKSDVRTQFAALCYRVRKGKPQILLITSRRTNRWIVPKGWPIRGNSPSECAAIEAWEEAGVQGRVSDRCLGLFSYIKYGEGTGPDLPCVAMVYPLKVKSMSSDYPEAAERKRQWVGRKKAASLVQEPELAYLLRTFDPKSLLR